MSEQGFCWVEPRKRPGLLWRTVFRSFGFGVSVFAVVAFGGPAVGIDGDVAYLAGAGLSLAAFFVALLFDRRQVTLDASGVRVAGLMGRFPARRIPFAQIGRVEIIVTQTSLTIPKPYDAEGRIVGQAVFPAQPLLHLWSRDAPPGGAGRSSLSASAPVSTARRCWRGSRLLGSRVPSPNRAPVRGALLRSHPRPSSS